MSELNPIPKVVQCEDCGRLLEAPLMTDAEDCCKKAVKNMALAYAVKEVGRLRDREMRKWEVDMLSQLIDSTLFLGDIYNEPQEEE